MIADLQYIQTLIKVNKIGMITIVCFDCDEFLAISEAVLWLDPNSLDFTYLCEACNEKRLKEMEAC